MYCLVGGAVQVVVDLVVVVDGGRGGGATAVAGLDGADEVGEVAGGVVDGVAVVVDESVTSGCSCEYWVASSTAATMPPRKATLTTLAVIRPGGVSIHGVVGGLALSSAAAVELSSDVVG
ncbi:hypothetical protein [Mycolicibacterium moriokaense]|uniref:hypothetical protein n=1 Tax=Mycolicibacterium moriokaense TaxID=39691 RepID=UPI001C64CD86|nr:hypothetical protein [Mycolicibacterium moriokaense]